MSVHYVNQLAAQQKSNIEALLAISHAAFGNAERLLNLNVNATRNALEESAAQAKAAVNSSDSIQALLQASQPQQAFAKVTSYLEDVRQIVTQTQQELTEIIDAQRSETSDHLVKAIEELAKTGPAGSAFAASTLKSMFAMGNSAYDKLNDTAKQVAQIGEAQIAAAAAKSIGAPSSSSRARKAA
ncbi:MAG TPA: phasin family protein [Rhodocyclaceae bacterium]|nr:phasin family protein [Rhodocyclaceae bacterium]